MTHTSQVLEACVLKLSKKNDLNISGSSKSRAGSAHYNIVFHYFPSMCVKMGSSPTN